MQKEKHNMAEGSIIRKLILFAVPILLGDLLQQLYVIIDSIIVGQGVGKTAFAAVSVTGTLTNTLVGFFVGMSIGATAVIARCFGAKDQYSLIRAVYTTINMTLVLSVIISIIGVVFTPKLLNIMNVPKDVYPEAELYLKIYFGGISGLMMYNMLSGILRAVGDSARPLYFLCFSAIVNLVLDVALILIFKMGVAGAAIATIGSQFISAGILLYILADRKEYCHIEWKFNNFDVKICLEIISVGLPVALQRSITSLSNLIIRAHIYAFGTDVMAGWSAYNRIDDMILIPLQSMAMATTTFVGQNLGAGRYDRIDNGIKSALKISWIMTIVLSAMICVFCRNIIKLFCPDEAVVYYGVSFLRSLVPMRWISCINQVLAGALRGLGKSKAAMIIMLFSFVLCRQFYLLIITQFNAGLWLVVISYPLGWIICSAVSLLYFKKYRANMSRLLMAE